MIPAPLGNVPTMGTRCIFRLISARQTRLLIGMKNEKEAVHQSRATLVLTTSQEDRVIGVATLSNYNVG